MPQVSLKYNICLFYNIYEDVTLQDKVIFVFFSYRVGTCHGYVASCLLHFSD